MLHSGKGGRVGQKEVVLHQRKVWEDVRRRGRRGTRMGRTAGRHGRRKDRGWYRALCDKARPRTVPMPQNTQRDTCTHMHAHPHITHPPIHTRALTPTCTHTHTHAHTHTYLYNTIHTVAATGKYGHQYGLLQVSVLRGLGPGLLQ